MRFSKIADRAIYRDSAQSHIANAIANDSLQCRRFEKDVFLNIDDAASRDNYFAQWKSIKFLTAALEGITLLVWDTLGEEDEVRIEFDRIVRKGRFQARH